MNEKGDIQILVKLLTEENALLRKEVSWMKERIAYLEARLFHYY
jgi:hypothetical protein